MLKVSILYDNLAREGFQGDWGFSCLIGENVLFDMGRNLHILSQNINKLGVDLSRVEHVVLSHHHKDHIGGIGILEQMDTVNVYVPASFSTALKDSIESFQNAKIVEVRDTMEITGEVTSLGEIGDGLREQAVVVETKKGVSLITGCAHPGLELILEKAEVYGKIYAVIGGFHDFDRLLALENSRMIVPCHCTKKRDEIRNLYKYTSKQCASGTVLDI